MLTKTEIEKMAYTIYKILKKEGISEDMRIYFNNKAISTNSKGNINKVLENIDPHDYFEYAAYKHIISISTEGGLYDRLNYGAGDFPKKLEELFEKTGIYYELGNSWNLTFYPIKSDMEIEYTIYTKEEEIPINYLGLSEILINNIPKEIKPIMEKWYNVSKITGDIGGCVIGAGFSFIYNKKKYFMNPCSPYQGEGSWLPYIEEVEKALKYIGASNIKWHNGILD